MRNAGWNWILHKQPSNLWLLGGLEKARVIPHKPLPVQRLPSVLLGGLLVEAGGQEAL